VTFSSTVQSPTTAYNLTVNDSGTSTFSAAVGGGGNPLASVTTNAAARPRSMAGGDDFGHPDLQRQCDTWGGHDPDGIPHNF